MLAVDIEKIPFYQDGLKDGLIQGLEKAKVEIARNLLKVNMSIDLVAKTTGLCVEDVEALKKDLINKS